MAERDHPDVPQALLVLYRTMATADLERLRRAFTLDLAASRHFPRAAPAFYRLRLTLIARVLEERGVETHEAGD